MVTVAAQLESLSEDAIGKAAIIATELGTNLLKHATAGELHITRLSERGARGIEILSIDRGPGMSDINDSLRDGHSTSGTAGTGLGAVRRLSDKFDMSSLPGRGTVLLSQVFPNGAAAGPAVPSAFEIGLTARPIYGETVSGDSWALRVEEHAMLLMVADGLGHGILAAEASQVAVKAFCGSRELEPVELVQALHRALLGTRGAAVAVARLEPRQSRVRFAGLGNIVGAVVSASKAQAMVSHNGTAGFGAVRSKEFVYPWTAESFLVMHSDGLSGSWNPATFPGLSWHHPSVIAALLYRDAARVRDDACIVVAKGTKKAE
jgi:anti-sigma regulatory factor (Ser/Thr protein kinase)/serine/threonine protein phosphatase PrpC